MTKTPDADDGRAEAARILHEDKVSPGVERALKQLKGKRWVLYHARDYTLGVLQLLEHLHLLRDLAQEEKDAESHKQMIKAFGPAVTPREKAYKRLCYAAADALPDSFREAVQALADVRTDEELDAAKAPTMLEVHAWRHGGSSADALALARVRSLVGDNWRRKTISRADLLEALGIEPRD